MQSASEPMNNSALRDIIAGALSGFLGKIIEYPFDTVKVLMQSDLQSGGKSASSISVLKRIVQLEGFSGLYNGLSLPLLGTIIESSILFSVNSSIKQFLCKNGGYEPHNLPLFHILLSGAGTGFVVSHFLTPVELIKCRMQAQANMVNQSQRYTGTLDCIRKSVQNEGVSVLFRGHLATVLREVPGTACWFGAYESFVRLMTAPGQSRESLSSVTVVTAGAMGGMAYWGVMYPADTVKSVMQTSLGGKSSFGRTLSDLYMTVGLRGLYSGITPTLVRAAPANAVLFLGYEYSMKLLKAIPIFQDKLPIESQKIE